jgi:hypothetical protein
MFPGYTNFGRYGFLFISIPYLAVMPFVGALGAYLSRRMKGSVVERILSALFPVFTFAALFAVRIVYGLFFEREPYTLPHFLLGLFMTLIFIIVGGLFLVLGAWPFCRSGKFKPSDLTAPTRRENANCVRPPNVSRSLRSISSIASDARVGDALGNASSRRSVRPWLWSA